MKIPNLIGNEDAVRTLEQMASRNRIHQTILLSGPEGIGKATLARRFAGELIGAAAQVERDDLSLDVNQQVIAEREKWPSDKRADDPLVFGSHPDFLTFAPDGPLRQITIQQMRLLKQRAPFKPLRGRWRVFLIDQIEHANDQAANSLLKTLEEPPEHLMLILTAVNPYDLLPTIRSRALPLHLGRLSEAGMSAFAAERGLQDPERRIALAQGSPGVAVTLDLESYDRRRATMLSLIESASGLASFGSWVKTADAVAALRSEKLDSYLRVLYVLLEDILLLGQDNGAIRNIDIRGRLNAIARHVSFGWLRKAVARADELVEMSRRNVQKNVALDAFIAHLR